MSCPNTERCPLYERFASEVALRRWRRLYCDSPRHTSCERFTRKAAGEPVAPRLLPNGTTLPIIR